MALIQEKQVKRENLLIIGLGCHGVVDANNLDCADFRLQDITALEWTADGLNVTTASSQHTLPRSDVLRDMCIVCTKREPAISDVRLGEGLAVEEAAECLSSQRCRRRAVLERAILQVLQSTNAKVCPSSY